MKTDDYFLAALRTAPIDDPSNTANQVTRLEYLELLENGTTMAKGKTATLDVWHGILGIAGEASELLELFEKAEVRPDKDALVKEIGDIWWYVAPLVRGLHGSAEKEFKRIADAAVERANDLNHGVISLATNRITEPMKKWIWYGKQINLKELEDAVVELLAVTIFVADMADVTIEEVLDANIAKLKARYPERFDEAAAVAKADERA